MLIHKSCTLFSLCVSQPEHNDWAPIHLMNEDKMTVMLLCCSGFENIAAVLLWVTEMHQWPKHSSAEIFAAAFRV